LSKKIQDLSVVSVVQAKSIQSLLGIMVSMIGLLPLANLHRRPLQRAFAARFRQSSQDWTTRIRLGQWFTEAVQQWTVKDWLSKSMPILPPEPVVEIFVDASLQGWGAHTEHKTACGQWSPQQKLWHINRLELQAVLEALSVFLGSLPQGHLRVVSDNTTVVSLINHQGASHAPRLSKRVEQILLFAQEKGWSLSARHLKGSLNIMADLLSRQGQIIPTEWTLRLPVLTPLWSLWGQPEIDLFATQFNARLPRYVSPVPDSQAWAIDALSLDWDNLSAYAFPPLPLIRSVLCKVQKANVRLILVAPYWPRAVWFPLLVDLAHSHPVQLRVKPQDLFQPQSGILHKNPQNLNLHGWLLCEDTCRDQVCLKKL